MCGERLSTIISNDMNTLLNSFEKSDKWSLYCIESNTHIYSQSAYNYKCKRRCTLYAIIKFNKDNTNKLESITLEESWEEVNSIEYFVLAVFYVDCTIKFIDKLVSLYL